MPRRPGCLRAEPLPKIIQGAAVSDSETGSGGPSCRKPQAHTSLTLGTDGTGNIFFFHQSQLVSEQLVWRKASLHPPHPPFGNRSKLPPPLP